MSRRRTARPKPQSGGTIELGALWAAVIRYPVTSAASVLLAVAVAAAVWVYLPLPKMTGYMVYQISAAPLTMISPVGSDRADFQMYRQRQAAAVKSRTVLNAALNWEPDRKEPDRKEPDRKEPDRKGIAELPLIRSKADPINWLEEQIRVDFRQGPEFMRVTIEGDDPEALTAILTAVGNAYMADLRNKENSLKLNEKKIVEKTLAAYSEELAKEQQAIRKYEESMSMGAADPTVIAVKQKIADERLWTTQKQLIEVQSQILRLDIDQKAAKARAEATPSGASETAILTAVRNDPEVQRLTGQLKQLADAIAAYQPLLKPGATAPALVRLQNDLATTEKELAAAKARVREETKATSREQQREAGTAQATALADQIASLQEYKKVLEADVKKQEQRVRVLDSGQFELTELREKILEKQRIAQQLASRVEAIRVELDTPSRAEMLEPPTTVPGIEGNRRLRYAAMAAGAVLACGLAINLIRDRRQPRVSGPDHLENQVGLPVVGVLPWVPALAESSAVIGGLSDWEVALSESLAATRLVMLNGRATDIPVRTLLVVSALPGEGKSSVALQLAASLAHAGHPTVLVDGDMRRPRLHARLGMTNDSGLAEVLRGEVPTGDAVAFTGTAGLFLLPAGRWDPAASRAVCNGRWKDVLGELTGAYEYVVIDSTPLLPVADGLAMARHVDGVIVSVLRGVSQTTAVVEVRKRLAAVRANVLGVVLSGASKVPRQYAQYAPTTDVLVPLSHRPVNNTPEVSA